MSLQPWVYVAWFRDLSAQIDDQDREWVACLRIHAPSTSAAQQWGDHLAQAKCARSPALEFLRSEIQPAADPQEAAEHDGLPEVHFGEEPSDEKIGW